MSTVAAVRAALVTRFTTALAGTGTVVTYGHPGQQMPTAYVAVANTVEGLRREQRRMPLSSTSMEEDYEISVIVWHEVGDHDQAAQQTCTEQAWATADLIEVALRNETTLGGLVQHALITQMQDLDFLLNEGRAAEITCTVTVHKTRA